MALPFYVEPTDPPSKQEILKAALHLFGREGVRESSIRAVAAEAGFTNPVLFKHFESKEALALHLFERCYLRLVREASDGLSSPGSFEARLGLLLRNLLALLDEAPDAVLFVNEEFRRYWPQVSPAVRKRSLVALLRGFFEEGLREGAVTRKIDRSLLVAGFLGTVAQFARQHAFGEWPGKAIDAAPQLEALLLKMLSP
jgi:TetR/AcrR family transcriptional regulator, repressor of fatR-cypB operon